MSVGAVSLGVHGQPGTRVRAGNTMGATQQRLLDAAARLLAERGTKITMVEIATAAGVAKATLYNHFRTKEELVAALVLAEIERIRELARRADSPTRALAVAAWEVSEHPVLRRLRASEPAALAELLATPARSRGWRAAADAVAQTLGSADVSSAGLQLVLRWLVSCVLLPCGQAQAESTAAVLRDALAT